LVSAAEADFSNAGSPPGGKSLQPAGRMIGADGIGEDDADL
jgi:hypothetical protein